MSFTVYLLIGDNNTPIYVGATRDADRRLREHHNDRTVYHALGGRTKREVIRRADLLMCTDHDDMCATELRLIQKHRPILNVLDNPHPVAVARLEQIHAARDCRGPADWVRGERGWPIGAAP
jgi:predicted GIY-YIG superfamily endonuclease